MKRTPGKLQHMPVEGVDIESQMRNQEMLKETLGQWRKNRYDAMIKERLRKLLNVTYIYRRNAAVGEKGRISIPEYLKTADWLKDYEQVSCGSVVMSILLAVRPSTLLFN